MAKNPVFPLYYNDLDRSTRDWSDEEFGAYVRLLVHQWDKGSIPKDYQRLTRIATSLDTNWGMLKCKFVDTPDGLKNKVLEDIREKVLKHKEKQKENILKRYQTSTKNLPLEDENEILKILETIQEFTNAEKGIDKNFFVMLALKMIEIFKKSNSQYPVNKNLDYSACLQIAYNIAEIKKWKKYDVVNGKLNECLDSWKNIVSFIEKDEWLSTRSLSDISSTKEWQRLVQKMNKKKKEDEPKSTAPTLKTLANHGN